MSRAENNDYQLAKGIIDTMKLHEQVFIDVTSLGNFRKYLREIVNKRQGIEQFTTRHEIPKVKVIRIR